MFKRKRILILLSFTYFAIFFGGFMIFCKNFKNVEKIGNFTTIPPFHKKTASLREIFHKSKYLLDFIHNINQLQPIQNNHFIEDLKLIIIIQVHNRTEYLRQILISLRQASQINSTLIIFSHDIYDENINVIVNGINFAPVMQIFYPFSIQTHPDAFPGTVPGDCDSPDNCQNLSCNCPNFHFRDSYGQFRNASLVQIKHHWWWKINFVFNKISVSKSYNGLFLFLEEDHYLAPDFIHCLGLMVKYRKYICPKCWFYALGLHDRYNFGLMSDYTYIQKEVQNLGLAFNRTVWNQISKYSEKFCNYDDYNWDWSLRHVVMNVVPEIPLTMAMAAARAIHIGYCGAHSTDSECNASDLIQFYKKRQINLFPKQLGGLENNEEFLFFHNGGWGDPRDHALCMAM